ncbi:MAG: LacI family DNA-binding transcriptional regulator [Pseudomonadota bacterium]
MTHRFPIKEIARQAGLGPATVDRVLNNRAHVSDQTRRRVLAAMEELEGQETQLAARGRRLFFDMVVEAPARFSREVRKATEAVLPEIGIAVCRPRFIFQDIMEEAEVVDTLRRIAKRGSQGLCLKARDTAPIREAVEELARAGIPVVTLVTDIGSPARLDYVGLDNASAGRTAAYLIRQTLGPACGTVLATRSHEDFLGEQEREAAFVAALSAACPALRVVSVQGGGGVGYGTAQVLERALHSQSDVYAVYSMGGGNQSILRTLKHLGLRPRVYVAHDLDQDNRALIAGCHIDYVLHHDLRADIRNAFTAFLAFHRLAPAPTAAARSTVQILTPENLPL